MKMEKICALGGSGFVGRHIVRLLAAQGYEVCVPTRRGERAKELILLPTVEVIGADVHDPAQLRRLFAGADAVINLVGVLHENRKGDFAAAHVELPRKIIEACRAAGVKRLLHMSALNADPGGPSAYLRSKGEGERLVRESGLAFTVFRPSVIFGPGDTFLNLFAALLRRLPVMLLACPDARFQPVFVEDVARVFAESLTRRDAPGQSYDLCGPQIYTLRQLVGYVSDVTGHAPPVVGLGAGLSYLQAALLEQLPGRLMTRDNVRSMQLDSVCACVFPYGIAPAPLEAVVPRYLAQHTPRARYALFRHGAGR